MKIIALRGEAALKARLPREAKKNASISPYGKGIIETVHVTPTPAAFDSQMWERPPPCVGDLMHLTRKGNFLYYGFALCLNVIISEAAL